MVGPCDFHGSNGAVSRGQAPSGSTPRRRARCGWGVRAPLAAGWLLLALSGTRAEARAAAGEPHASARLPNILLVIADDLGVDKVGAYGEHPQAPPTPNIDALAQRGVLFRNAWSSPVCSPTRANLLTGRYASGPNGMGIGLACTPSRPGLPGDVKSLAWTLSSRGYRTAAIGKWHLTGETEELRTHPHELGFQFFSGHRGNLVGYEDYFHWLKTVNGVTTLVERYATTDNVDDAIRFVQEAGQQPWFLWLAFHAPHSPYHRPPDHLHTQELPAGFPGVYARQLLAAMVEAVDTELGRLFVLLDGLDEPPVVVFLGDNGTQGVAVTSPFISGRAKGTLYEGGVNVPLIVSGPQVAQPGREVKAVVNLTDLFATVLELAGVDAVDVATPHSVSMMPYLTSPSASPRRSFVFAERFQPNCPPGTSTSEYDFWDRAILENPVEIDGVLEQLKIIVREDPPEFETEVYDLQADPFEMTDISERLTAGQRARLDDLLERASRL